MRLMKKNLTREEGMTTVVVLLLLMALTVMGIGGIVVSTMEGNIAANQYVGKQASFAAEAGADRAILWLQCYLSKTTQLGEFDSAYSTSGDFPLEGTTDPYIQTSYDPEGPLSAVRVFRYYTASPYTTRLYNNQPVRFPDNVVAASSLATLPSCDSVLPAADLSATYVGAVRGNLTLSDTNLVLGKTLDFDQRMGSTATVELVSRNPIAWRVVSIGSKTVGGAPVAAQAVAYTIEKPTSRVDPPGALATGVDLVVSGNTKITSDTSGKWAAITDETVTINGSKVVLDNPDNGLIDPNAQCNAGDPCNQTGVDYKANNLDDNFLKFNEIFFPDKTDPGSELYDPTFDVDKALDLYKSVAKPLSDTTVPHDCSDGSIGYNGLYYIDLGSSSTGTYSGNNALTTCSGKDAIVVIINNTRNVDITVTGGGHFSGMIYAFGDFDVRGNAAIYGSLIVTGITSVEATGEDTETGIVGTASGAKISYEQSRINRLPELFPYVKKKRTFAEVGLLR